MKIVSKFKDYYDHIGQRYGQDPEVVYLRGKVKPLKEMPKNCCHFVGVHKTDEKTRTDYTVFLLVAGEFLFPMVRMDRRTKDVLGETVTVTEHRHLDKAMLYWISNNFVGKRTSSYYTPDYYWNILQENLSSLRRQLPQLMRECGAPVFLIQHAGGKVNVSEQAPVLKDLGVPALVPAAEMWQNIYATLTNVLRSNPDKEPPVEICDKDKIVKAGFDLKTSFRDPVNVKPKKRRK